VQKAGTSALAHYLSGHPRLRLPRDKEAHIFDDPAFNEDATRAEVDARYAPLFAPLADGAIHGDATPIYLLHPRLIQRIARYNPTMRWIVLLRNPVARAISQYHMERARGDETWPFWTAMLLERWRLRGHADDFRTGSPLRHHGYRLRGDYARQLDALYASFPHEQVLLLTNSELREDPTGTVRKACDFLGVAPIEGPLQAERVFAGEYTALPRNGLRMRLLRWLMRRERRDMRERYGIVFND
jgi:hypothetical protein